MCTAESPGGIRGRSCGACRKRWRDSSGIFDLSFLSNIPNMTVMSPKNKWELADMLRFALQMNSPVAIRYPRGKAYDGYEGCREKISYGKSEWILKEKKLQF